MGIVGETGVRRNVPLVNLKKIRQNGVMLTSLTRQYDDIGDDDDDGGCDFADCFFRSRHLQKPHPQEA